MTRFRENQRAVLIADRLIDGTGTMPQTDVALIVEGNQIAAIVPAPEWHEVVGDLPYEVHRYPGSTLLPGLIDGHVHLTFSALGTAEEVLEEFMESDDLRLAAMAIGNGHRCLTGGVTTVRDCGGPGTIVQALRDTIAAGVTRGPRILACGMPITTTAGHCHFFGLEADGELEIRKAVRSLVKDDADVIKVMATGGRMTRGSNIFQPQYTENEMKVLVEEARRLERPVAAHALSTEGIRYSVAAGVDTIEHCNWQDEEGVWEFDEDVLAKMAESGTHIGITLVGYMRDAYDAWLDDPVSAPIPPILKRRFQLEGEMFMRGLNAFISSDAGVPGSHFAELHRSVAVAVGWLGLDPLTALAAVTSRAALALGIQEMTGSLTVGRRADIIVVAGDPSVDVRDLGRLQATYLEGERVVYKGGVIPTDPRAIGQRPKRNRRSGGWLP